MPSSQDEQVKAWESESRAPKVCDVKAVKQLGQRPLGGLWSAVPGDRFALQISCAAVGSPSALSAQEHLAHSRL